MPKPASLLINLEVAGKQDKLNEDLIVPDEGLLLIASTNAGKLREFYGILAGLPLRLVSPADLGIELDVEETGTTYLENARLKANAFRAAALAMGYQPWVLADDSGIEVDALDGAPGVYSTRWAGENTTAQQRYELLLERIKDVPTEQRGAHFRAFIVLLDPVGREFVAEGTVDGRIAAGPRNGGGAGFGYDPIFELPGRGQTMAELSQAQKDVLSHRGIAGNKVREHLLVKLK